MLGKVLAWKRAPASWGLDLTQLATKSLIDLRNPLFPLGQSMDGEGYTVDCCKFPHCTGGNRQKIKLSYSTIPSPPPPPLFFPRGPPLAPCEVRGYFEDTSGKPSNHKERRGFFLKRTLVLPRSSLSMLLSSCP